jgi:hypothetical protein
MGDCQGFPQPCSVRSRAGMYLPVSAAFNDEPTLRDQLNRAGWVASFADNIRNCQTPYVFGVHGDWGAGKTSFLHQLHFHLTGEPVCKADNGACPPIHSRKSISNGRNW